MRGSRRNSHREPPEPIQRLAAQHGIDLEELLTQLRDTTGDTSSLSFVSGLLLGLVVGIVVALALAPQSGKHTRQQVWETGIELSGRRRSQPADVAAQASL
jgi:hypothetical protein